MGLSATVLLVWIGSAVHGSVALGAHLGPAARNTAGTSSLVDRIHAHLNRFAQVWDELGLLQRPVDLPEHCPSVLGASSP